MIYMILKYMGMRIVKSTIMIIMSMDRLRKESLSIKLSQQCKVEEVRLKDSNRAQSTQSLFDQL